jgi:hypothetical protein
MTAPRKTAARKSIPANAPQPQDHKQKQSAAARKAEADGFVIVEQCGIELKIPVGAEAPLEVLILSTQEPSVERDLKITEEVLGAEQWAALRAAKPKIGDLNELSQKIREATGNL